MKLEFFLTDFRKMHQYQISRISVQREPCVSMQTDGLGEVNSRFSQFYESAENTFLLKYFCLSSLLFSITKY